jgi:hypothetical protein
MAKIKNNMPSAAPLFAVFAAFEIISTASKYFAAQEFWA